MYALKEATYFFISIYTAHTPMYEKSTSEEVLKDLLFV